MNHFKRIALVILLVVLLGGGAFLFLRNAEPSETDPNRAPIVTFETSMGDILVEMYPDKAPKNVENILSHVTNGTYDQTIIHRVVPDFVIQGGDYEHANGTGGQAASGGFIEDEFDPTLSHTRGMMSMANRGPNTNGSQFFFVIQPAPFLDGKHTILGRVLRGMDIVDAISEVPRDAMHKPVDPVMIKQVTVQ